MESVQVHLIVMMLRLLGFDLVKTCSSHRRFTCLSIFIGLTRAFKKRGCRVFGSVRSEAKVGRQRDEGIEFVIMDQNKKESIKSAIDELISKAGKLDILVVSTVYGTNLARKLSLLFGLVRVVQGVSMICLLRATVG